MIQAMALSRYDEARHPPGPVLFRPVAGSGRDDWRRKMPGAGVTGFWLLAGLALRVWQFGWYPLRPDEALYSVWARLISSGQDVMLERVAVDKPPFFLYLLARWFDWFGPSDAAGRSLNVFISFLTMILIWLLACRLFGRRMGRWSLAMFALSPFAISFAPTVYTDPLLTFWVMLALLLASWRVGLLTGLALGMGFATKQNALLFIPLILLALTLGRWPRAVSKQWAVFSERWAVDGRMTRAMRWGAPFLMAGLGFWYAWFKVWQWNDWRILPAEIPDFWTQSWHSYGGLHLLPPAAWPQRLIEWWRVWRWWGGGAVATLIIVGLSGVAVAAAWRVLRNHHAAKEHDLNTALWLLLFGGFSVAYLALHVIFSFQAWDRYLLPLAPPGAILSAYGALRLWEKMQGWRRIWRWGVAALVAIPLLIGAGQAAAARIPVGGDHGAYSGLLTVADYLQENTPGYHGVVYQRWLGWQWNWYLWNGPPRVYWANPDMLISDLAPHRYGYTRFVVFPGWELQEKTALDAALADAGLHLAERLRVADGETGEMQFVVYEIEPLVVSVPGWDAFTPFTRTWGKIAL